MSHPFFGGAPKPRIFGHRGFVSAERAAAGIVENTRDAVDAALRAGAEYIEVDCQLTSDGRVVLFHDSKLKRVLGDSRRVEAVTHAELAGLMADRGGLLTLQDAIAEFPTARFNIDMKSAAVAEPAGALIGALAPDRVLISSFSDGLRLRSLAAAEVANTLGMRPVTGAGQRAMVRIVAAVALGSRGPIDRAFAGIDAVQVPERQGPVPVLTDALLREAHARGVEVHAWTINDPARMLALTERGVDGIITDRTDLAMEALR